MVSNLVCSEEALPAGMFGFAAAALPNLGLKTPLSLQKMRLNRVYCVTEQQRK